MLSADAEITTTRPSRYLVQLCKHAAAMGGSHGHRPRMNGHGDAVAISEVGVHAEWSESHGVVEFAPWGRCTLRAIADTLLLHVEATDAETLQRIEGIITRDLVDRLGRRDHLTVAWKPPSGDQMERQRPQQDGPP